MKCNLCGTEMEYLDYDEDFSGQWECMCGQEASYDADHDKIWWRFNTPEEAEAHLEELYEAENSYLYEDDED